MANDTMPPDNKPGGPLAPIYAPTPMPPQPTLPELKPVTPDGPDIEKKV